MLADGVELVVSVHGDDLGDSAAKAIQVPAELPARFTARRPEGDQQKTLFLGQQPPKLLAAYVLQFSLSITMAMPWPPPTHMVSSP